MNYRAHHGAGLLPVLERLHEKEPRAGVCRRLLLAVVSCKTCRFAPKF